LPPLLEDLPLSFSDRLAIWVASENKTKRVDLQSIYTFLLTGGNGGTHAPVSYGGSLIYKVPADVPAGTTTVAIPSLAGKDFLLRRGGLPLIPQKDPPVDDAQFEVLNAGGFKLVQDDDELMPGEIFELFIYELVGQAPGEPTAPSNSGGFIKGKKTVVTNTTLDPLQDINKVIQIRGGSSSVTLTLASVEDMPVNSFLVIETNIGNTRPSTITTTGGQFFYLKNTSKTTMHMHPGEVAWVYRDDDGFYVINDFQNIYKQIGKPFASYSYSPSDNEIVCMGQEVNRADYPRLWEYASSLGSSLVSEATWQTTSETVLGKTVPYPYRGCFSSGNGTTTFRMPQLLNVVMRGLKSVSGSDPERFFNNPGGFQLNEIIEHDHTVKPPDANSAAGFGKSTTGNDASENTGIASFNTGKTGGSETRMDNVGFYLVMKY